jgi:hypothetical protein
MTRPSKIDKLQPEIRDAIAKWRLEGKTIDEVMACCFDAYPDVPDELWPRRSGFGAHIQGLDKLAETVQRSRAIAEALVRKFGDAPENRQARLNIELMHGLVTNLMLSLADKENDGEPVTLQPDEVHDLAKALDHLARASRSDLELTLRLRKEIAAEQNDKVEAAARDVASSAKEAGLSAERVAELQAKVAGLRIEPRPEKNGPEASAS